MLLEKPVFQPHLSIQLIGNKHVIIRSESERYLLKGRLYSSLCSLIDGQNDLDDIVDQLSSEDYEMYNRDNKAEQKVGTLEYKIEDIYYAVERLRNRGFLTENQIESKAIGRNEQAFWSGIGMSVGEASNTIRSKRVQIIALGENIDTQHFSDVFQSMDIEVSDNGEIAVVVTDNYQHPRLKILNQQFLKEGKKWLMLRPQGLKIWIGPLLGTESTPCWECLNKRLSENGFKWTENAFEENLLVKPTLGFLKSNISAGYALAATQIATLLADIENHPLENALITIDTTAIKADRHFITKRPQCPACGDGGSSIRNELEPIELNASDKQFTADGGHRIMGPKKTFDILQQYVSPITGVVGDLVKTSPKYSNIIHVYRTSRNRSTFSFREDNFDHSMISKGMVAGKGMTDAQARASCVGEGIERFSCEFQGNESRMTARYIDIADTAIHPEKLLQFSDWQYDNRSNLNPRNLRFNSIPERFDEKASMEWYDAWSLTHSAWRKLPAAFCYFNYPKCPYIGPDSNGCAGGNNLEEAIFQGFMELIERDAVAIWWYNRLQRPEVELEGFNEPYFASIAKVMKQLGRTLKVLDLTTDLGIPVFVAVSWDEKGGDIHLGMGAHLDARIAISRAITEMNQCMYRLNGKRPSVLNKKQNQKWNLEAWLNHCTIDEETYIQPLKAFTKTNLDYRVLASGSIREDIQKCVAIMAEHDMEVIVSRLSRRDLNYETVRVTVPGLRHFWWRLAPGRLYDVPVKMGWIAAATREEDMNPIPFFL